MAPRPNSCLATALAALLAAAPAGEAIAGGIVPPGGFGTLAAGPACGGPFGGGGTNVTNNITIFKPVNINTKVNIYKPITINKSVVVNKPVTINNTINNSKNISINKPVTITNNINNSKNISINKPVTINNDVNITKNIDLSKNINIDKSVVINKNIDASKNINIQKNVTINKSIVINKGGSGNAEASAFAYASAYAAAQANASATAISYGGSQYVTVVNKTGNVGGELSVNAQAQCVEQDANVVKSIHAVCVDRTGREYPASHMIPDTWIDASFEGEVARCIPGAVVRATVGDVAQSDQGLAGTYEHGETLACAAGEALVHYRGGMLKCAKAKPVKDCTERVNLRRWGSGDFFFSYRSRVCVMPSAQAAATSEDLSGMTLEGGVGAEDSGY